MTGQEPSPVFRCRKFLKGGVGKIDDIIISVLVCSFRDKQYGETVSRDRFRFLTGKEWLKWTSRRMLLKKRGASGTFTEAKK